MKKLLLLPLLWLISSCVERKVDVDPYLAGNHELRRLSSIERKTPSTLSASYFLFWGSMSGKGESSESYVGFSWKNKSNEYVLSRVESSKVRLKFEQKTDRPYVTFGYDPVIISKRTNDVNANLAWIVSSEIDYIVIHCKESDYSPDFNAQDINP